MVKNCIWGTLVLAIALILAGCDNGTTPDESPPGEGQLESGYFGDTLIISGQVYNENGTLYKGNHASVTSGVGGSGIIENGILTFSIGTPSPLKSIALEFSAGSEWGYCFNGITFSQNSAQVASLVQLYFDGSSDIQRKNMDTGENVDYLYVDRDVTVTGTGKTITEGGSTISFKNLELKLKKGWNAIYYDISGGNITAGDLSSVHWMRWGI